MQVEDYEFLEHLLAPPWQQVDSCDISTQYEDYNLRYFLSSDLHFLNIENDCFVSVSDSLSFLRIQRLNDDSDCVSAKNYDKKITITECRSFVLLEVLESLFPSYSFVK